MLQNEYLIAKIGADTAENEGNSAENLPKIGNYPTGPQAAYGVPTAPPGQGVRRSRPPVLQRPRPAGGPLLGPRLSDGHRCDKYKFSAIPAK